MYVTSFSGIRDYMEQASAKNASVGNAVPRTPEKQGDIRAISDEARRLAVAEKDAGAVPEDTLAKFALTAKDMDKTLEGRIVANEANASEPAERGSGSGRGVDANASRLATLQKQIAAAQRELQKATAALQQAMAEGGEATVASAEASAGASGEASQAAPDAAADASGEASESAPDAAAGASGEASESAPDAAAGASGEASPEGGGDIEGQSDVTSARMAVTEVNNRLRVLKEEMNKAMREAFGMSSGGGGCIQGTEVGSVGGPKPARGHIGTSQDPYAAAAAAEALELGGAG